MLIIGVAFLSFLLKANWLFGLVMLIYSVFTGITIIRGGFKKMKKNEKVFGDLIKDEKPTQTILAKPLESNQVVAEANPMVNPLGIPIDNGANELDNPISAPAQPESTRKTKLPKIGINEIIEQLIEQRVNQEVELKLAKVKKEMESLLKLI